MKIRYDFVTNSSSSSFIISKDCITRDKLIEILLEMATKENEKYYFDDYVYTKDDVVGNVVAHHYIINETTSDKPEKVFDKIYDNHYVISNDECGRYDWNIVGDILNKYNIPWNMGYCS